MHNRPSDPQTVPIPSGPDGPEPLDPVFVPDVQIQIWLAHRTLLAMKFYEHDGELGKRNCGWNALEEADKTHYLRMAQDTMSNGAHDVVYQESRRRRENSIRMSRAILGLSPQDSSTDPTTSSSSSD